MNINKFLTKHAQYASYVFRHKWFVFREAVNLDVPFLGFVHDWSKFLPNEWITYTENFYGDGAEEVNKKSFDVAWLKHIHRQPHHWQHWILYEDSGAVKFLDMPEKYIREMVADWKGSGKAQGHDNLQEWFDKNRDHILLSPKTKMTLYILLERYDLLSDLIVETLKDSMPWEVIGVGVIKNQILLHVESLKSEETFENWFYEHQQKGELPKNYDLLIYERSQPTPKLLGYTEVTS